jgi:hypothetical protein
MVHVKVACSIRPAINFFHVIVNIPRRELCDGLLAGRAHAILP